MTLGHFQLARGAGCIRLLRPRWDEATSEDTLALSEGIEDALTVAQWVMPGWRVAAAVSLGALEKTWIPPAITRIVLIAQNDPPGSPAAKRFEKVRWRFRREGYDVRRVVPDAKFKDVNELAMHLAGR